MQRAYGPSVRRRRLNVRLRKYREQRGETTGQVARALGWQQTKVSKIETGERKKVTPEELDGLLDYYGEHSPEVREALHECARLGNQRGWWARYRELLPSGLPDFEVEASVIKTYECQVVPGLLQTPDYAEAVFRANLVRSDQEIAKRLEGRMKRQEVLNRVDPPEYWVIVDEAVLRRTVGSRQVMAQQLRHLTHMAARHNVNISVLPFDEGAHPATMGSFVIMEYIDPMDAGIGYVETPTSSLYVEDPAEVSELNSLFAGAQGAALSPGRSLTFIGDVIESLEA
ncbi:helix-turn-helix transcriptional regulator [Nocardiopsis sp. RSe5-2]|uniref:Helix-turn-helix transcriptional regulator n=1 Tax=Nocardiopsis endophytica TaxID=3018445 RepID=A0ABT4U422_9ACTN|nr:helix-turn-helix transcriptional regulator [Nocardiopsis endophytica]MDA2811709.1 helix-turn-helix transcriptional regulator [Nocardiopsis endophytica]